jgi:hypothetical protein
MPRRCRKVITNKSYLTALHVNTYMATKLLPKFWESNNPAGDTVPPPPALPKPSTHKKGGGGFSCVPLFKIPICLSVGSRRWPVQYEGLHFKGVGKEQRHLRFTTGWRYFVRDNDIQKGEGMIAY